MLELLQSLVALFIVGGWLMRVAALALICLAVSCTSPPAETADPIAILAVVQAREGQDVLQLSRHAADDGRTDALSLYADGTVLHIVTPRGGPPVLRTSQVPAEAFPLLADAFRTLVTPQKSPRLHCGTWVSFPYTLLSLDTDGEHRMILDSVDIGMHGTDAPPARFAELVHAVERACLPPR